MPRLSMLATLIPLALAIAWPPSSARSQAVSDAGARQAVLDATTAFARAYGGGAAVRAPVPGAVADPAGAGNNLADLSGMFDENATSAGTLQPFWLRGRGEIADLWSRYFARYPDRRMIFRQQDVRVFGDAAVETGYAEMYMGTSAATSVATFLRYSLTRVQRDGRWLIVSMIVDRLPAEQPPPGSMPGWANHVP